MIKATILILLLMGLGWVLLSLERRSLYFPDPTMIAQPSAYRLPFEDLSLTTKDEMKIHGWFIPGAMPFTLLFCHGNAGNISHRLEKLQIFHKIGLGVLFFDYRGYGQSKGVPSEAGTYADAEAAYRYLTETRHIPASQIILYGESLGCAVAVELARRHSAAALVLESPFTSTIEMAKRFFPWLPVRWMVRYHYDNLAKIPQIKIPLLIMHSPQDEIVPFEMGQKLFAAAPGPKTFVELTGDHNNGFAETGPHYAMDIQKFLNSLAVPRRS